MNLQYNDVTYEGIGHVEADTPTIAAIHHDYTDPDEQGEDSAWQSFYAVENATTALDALRKYFNRSNTDRKVIHITVYEKVMKV